VTLESFLLGGTKKVPKSQSLCGPPNHASQDWERQLRALKVGNTRAELSLKRAALGTGTRRQPNGGERPVWSRSPMNWARLLKRDFDMGPLAARMYSEGHCGPGRVGAAPGRHMKGMGPLQVRYAAWGIGHRRLLGIEFRTQVTSPWGRTPRTGRPSDPLLRTSVVWSR